MKVPQYAMYTALQRARPELAARVLIKYMFPEDVLVVSNVHGNPESGIRPLDHNKLSALRGEGSNECACSLATMSGCSIGLSVFYAINTTC